MKSIVHVNLAKGFRGGEKQTLLLILELAKCHDVKQTCIIRNNEEFAKRLKICKNLQIIQIKKPFIFHLHKLKNADILHAHESKAAQMCFLANMLFKTPYIITRRVNVKVKNNFFNRQMYKNASCCVGISQAVLGTIKNLGVKLNSCVIFDAISDFKTDQKSIKQIKGRFENKFLIGNIAALEQEKGQIHILKAAKILHKDYANLHFIFLGDGSKKDELKRIAKDLPNVSFEGFVDNVGDYIKCFDLFVFSSLNEGLGSSLLDVASKKVPIISSKVGGIGEIFTHQKTAILIEDISSEKLVKQIVLLFEDKNLASNIALNAHELSKKFSSKAMADEYIKVYKKN